MPRREESKKPKEQRVDTSIKCMVEEPKHKHANILVNLSCEALQIVK
jgi:hypothetical protein